LDFSKNTSSKSQQCGGVSLVEKRNIISRTNRILNELKSQGNIVCFRNLKNATDEAITLFSNKEAIEVIVMKPYEDYVQKFNQVYNELLQITPTFYTVNNLKSEEDVIQLIEYIGRL
jgi:type I restriction enzyme R subunit